MTPNENRSVEVRPVDGKGDEAGGEAAVGTRERILDAAGRIFADKGFRGATVKEICEAAGANIAAINYHFRDKESLYGEVLKYAHACAESLDGLQMLVSAPIPPDQKFAEFIKHMLRSMFAEGRPAWHGKLMAREMTEPTAALSTMVEHGIRPKFAVLRSIIADILGVPIEHDVVRWYGASVIAQCVFFYTNRPICERLYPDLTYEPEQVERMALHIVRFSLDGLHGAARQLSQVHS